ncbi:MAG: hypothetical protein R6V58_03185 [Planctomycetota bacterium]
MATALVLVAISRYGPGLSPDSTNYVAAARHFRAGEGFRGYDGTPFVKWPPLLPMALAAFGLAGSNIIWVGGVLNAVAYGAIVFVSGRMLYRYSRGSAPVILGTLCVTFSLPLFRVCTMLWSEPLFILLVLLSLWQLNRFCHQPSSGRLVRSALLVSAATLTRYTGVTIGATGCVLILFLLRVPLRKRLSACLLFGAIAAVPPAIWLGRNWFVTGTLAGKRAPSAVTLMQNVSRSGKELAIFFVPRRIVFSARFPARVFFVALVGTALAMTVFLSRRRSNRNTSCGGTYVLCIATFSIIYLAMLLVSATLTAFDGIDERLLSPLYVPGVFLAFLAFDELVLASRNDTGANHQCLKPVLRLLVVLAVTSAVLWNAFAAARRSGRVAEAVSNGAGGYNSRSWRKSEAIASLRSGSPSARMYSNRPAALYVLAGIPASKSPAKRFYASKKGTGVTSTNLFARYPGLDGSLLVWFHPNWGDYLFTVEELSNMCTLTPHAKFEDATIYRVRRSQQAPRS